MGGQTWDGDQKIKAGNSPRGIGDGSRTEQIVRSRVSGLRAALCGQGEVRGVCVWVLNGGCWILPGPHAAP